MGEVRVLARLMKAILKEKPNLKFCVSTYTESGQELARDTFKDARSIFYFPLDISFPLKRFFQSFRPDGIVMVETEIWPIFLSYCGRYQVPIILTNGRISEKSHRRYRKFKSSLAKLFDIYKRFAMQSNDDAARIIDIGANAENVIVTGNIKHDLSENDDTTARRQKVRRDLGVKDDEVFLIAASTRPGEEEAICQALKNLRLFPEKIKVMIAPRHLERLEEVVTILSQHHIKYKKYSDLSIVDSAAQAILMDKMGYLADIFYGADISFVGGTLADLGGHNLMEPVAAGVPVLFGPSIYNVKDAAAKILAANLGRMINDVAELSDTINGFVDGAVQFDSGIIKLGNGQKNAKSAASHTARMIFEEFKL
jgi:3-deoxy-D-manno-octulosonic-acid transferase